MTNASANNHRTEPFICVPQSLILRKDVSPVALKVLLVLYSFCNRQTGKCNPKRATLAARLGFSLSTLDRGMAQLRDLGVVRCGWNTGRGCSYEFPTPGEWKAAPRPVKPDEPASSRVTNQLRHQRQSQAPLSIYEPDVFEPEVLSRAAATTGESRETAAAAAAKDAAHNTKHPEGVEPASVPARPASTQVEKLTTPVEPQARPVSQGSCSEAEALAWELLAEHPQPGLPLKAVAEIEKVLRRDPAAAEVIRAHHPAWCEYWASLPAEKFVPMLWRWIAEGEWRIEPVVRKPMLVAGRIIDGRKIRFVEPLRR